MVGRLVLALLGVLVAAVIIVAAGTVLGSGATLATGSPIPAAPTNLTVTALNYSSVTVTWTNPTTPYAPPETTVVITNDTVYLALGTCGTTWAGDNSTLGAKTTWTYGGLASYPTVCVGVRAWTSGGGGPIALLNVTMPTNLGGFIPSSGPSLGTLAAFVIFGAVATVVVFVAILPSAKRAAKDRRTRPR